MSASEKLKALEFDPRSVFNSPNALLILTDALPQIVAVVEAAQLAHDEPYESDMWWRALGAALTALNEALGGDVT